MEYFKQTFHKDLLSSIVVFFVAMPLCMGIAIASGVPPMLGIITGIIGGLVVGFIAGAPLQVSGPAAGLTVLVYELVQSHGIEMLGPVVLLAGLFQVIAGFFKLGQWFRAVSPAVIHGMLGGIGVLIFASQFHVMLDRNPYGNGVQNLIYIPHSLMKTFVPEGRGSEAMLAGVLGLGTFIFMWCWEFFKRNPLSMIPAPLIAGFGSTLVTLIFDLPVKKVSIPDSFTTLITWPSMDRMLQVFQPDILPFVFGLALIASAETLLCASALTKMRLDAKVDYDKELFAQGVGNTVCGWLGTLPLTGVIVRSSANIKAGGQTRVAAIFHGAWLLVFVLLFPDLLRFIPMASLAAILVFTGYKLINPEIIKNLARYGRPALIIYFVTLTGIVATDLLTGVLLGVGASLIRLIFTFSALSIETTVDEEEKHIDVHLSGAATVITLPKLASTLESQPKDYHVTVHFSRLFYIDHACMDFLETERLKREGATGELEMDASRLRFTYDRSEKGRYHLPVKK
ncbi:Sulfate permease, MFS superfamily [Nitrosomonas marina]|uniref:Sulfate permease, MFS superfamily n=1 Tax=Nitrosomonas marina TaxID=917 RepID=A0A1I0BKD6_9PROT|nr:SulP family inorganic anion transporter [Nitrosomonas marina]SET06740.1 Sulfate permease, MFS superfamily [Nitrosomonas marina]